MTPPVITESQTIQGVYIARLQSFGDERGHFRETFRNAWFPQVSWEKTQHNRSDSVAGVLRGLHYHFHQVDYWYVPRGRVRAAMADLRASSPTLGASLTLEMGEENDIGLFIPTGVAHGFAALTDCTLTYVVNNYYDGGGDEHGIAWDDPDFAIDWGLEAPLLSARDQANPLFRSVSPAQRPR
jgi:dTDP-4-dehydrorhamnose 3,5-epimerase